VLHDHAGFDSPARVAFRIGKFLKPMWQIRYPSLLIVESEQYRTAFRLWNVTSCGRENQRTHRETDTLCALYPCAPNRTEIVNFPQPRPWNRSPENENPSTFRESKPFQSLFRFRNKIANIFPKLEMRVKLVPLRRDTKDVGGGPSLCYVLNLGCVADWKQETRSPRISCFGVRVPPKAILLSPF